LNSWSSQRNMSGPIFGDLSTNRWSGVLKLEPWPYQATVWPSTRKS
jgi:hypothetical protein